MSGVGSDARMLIAAVMNVECSELCVKVQQYNMYTLLATTGVISPKCRGKGSDPRVGAQEEGIVTHSPPL